MRQQRKHELAAALHGRYRAAERGGRGRIWDGFIATGYEHERATRVLRGGPPPAPAGHGGRPRAYSPVVVGALSEVAEASGGLDASGVGEDDSGTRSLMKLRRPRLPASPPLAPRT